jgi:DNA polymerase/3'-5' exonuclease PolX
MNNKIKIEFENLINYYNKLLSTDKKLIYKIKIY